jgi:hypothetical protein
MLDPRHQRGLLRGLSSADLESLIKSGVPKDFFEADRSNSTFALDRVRLLSLGWRVTMNGLSPPSGLPLVEEFGEVNALFQLEQEAEFLRHVLGEEASS